VAVTVGDRRTGGGRYDNVAVEWRDLSMVRQQRAVFARRHEIDADRVMPRVAARAIFDLEQVAVVFFVALHRHGPHGRGQRARETLELLLVGEVLTVGADRDERLDDL